MASQRVYDGLVTGYYGTTTAKYVYEWQRQNNIEDVTPDTGVGKITREKIRSATCAVVE